MTVEPSGYEGSICDNVVISDNNGAAGNVDGKTLHRIRNI